MHRCKALLAIARRVHAIKFKDHKDNNEAFGLASQEYNESAMIASTYASARQKYFKKMSSINSIVCNVYDARGGRESKGAHNNEQEKLNSFDSSLEKLEEIFRNGDKGDIDVSYHSCTSQ